MRKRQSKSKLRQSHTAPGVKGKQPEIKFMWPSFFAHAQMTTGIYVRQADGQRQVPDKIQYE